MGSGKRHKSDKSREVKKKRHRSRSRSSSAEERDKHRHHKKHKKRSRLVDYDSDVEIVSAPPPPKISRTSSNHVSSPPPPPPEISLLEKEDKHRHSKEDRYVKSKEDKYKEDKYRDDKYKEDRYKEDRYKEDRYKEDKYKQSRDDKYDQSKKERQNYSKEERSSRQKKSPSPPKGGATVTSLSIEETNRIRAKIGLKPLEVDTGPKEGTNLYKDDLGEFHHKPAINTAEKEKAQKLKDRINTHKEKRKIEAALTSIKTLGESDSDDDATDWVRKSRKIEEEKRKAAERAKMLDQMDQEFGIGDLVKEEVRHERRNAYTHKDLTGLRVEHNLDNFEEGKGIILTLKDKEVLAEDDDVLVNVNMLDNERYKKNVLIKSKKPGYDAYDETLDEYGMPVKKMLEKYDEEIDGEKRESFAIGCVDPKEIRDRKAAMVKEKLASKKLESLVLPEPMIAREYYSQEELVAFKKPKKKVRKIRKKVLKADDLISNSNDYLRDLGSRRRHRDEPRADENDSLDVDDLEAPKEDLSGIKLEEMDHDLDLKIKQKAKRLKGPVKVLNPDNIATLIKQEVDMDSSEVGPTGSITLNATAEFCRTLGDIPTYGQAGNREDNNQEFMDFKTDEVKYDYHNDEDEEMEERGAWNTVDTRKTSIEPVILESAILDEEPSLDQGVGGALKLAMSKGYLEKEDSNRPSASRFAHLRAQNYSIEDKTYGDDDKFGRRDRFNGPTSEFKEKEGFRPNVKLEYIDDDGHLLSRKEAFRYLSHKFHGKGPGKNKVEKRMKKSEQECLMKKMSSTDTPLGTLNLLQAKQKETQSPFIVLSGSKQMQTPSISKRSG